jgi:hypothetical protein
MGSQSTLMLELGKNGGTNFLQQLRGGGGRGGEGGG